MTDCGKYLLACEEGKDTWLKLGDPVEDAVSFHGHRAVFISRSPFLKRLLSEPQNYYGTSVYFDSPGAARHAFDVLRYLYLGAGCLTMEADALEAYCVIFERLEMPEELEAARGLLATYGEPSSSESEADEEKRSVVPSITLTVFSRPPPRKNDKKRRRAEAAAIVQRRSARLKKPRRSNRVRQLSVGR